MKKLRSNFQKAVAEGTRSGRAFSCILISSAAFNNKRHNEADHKRKIGTSCMFHVNIHADLLPVSCNHFILSDRAHVNLIVPV